MTSPDRGPSPDSSIRLRPTLPGDLPALFGMQCDPQSNEMAGTKPRTREVFFSVWEGHFANPRINSRVIELIELIGTGASETAWDAGGEGSGALGPELVGGISCFQVDEGGVRDCVGYWIARAHWGKGIASRALALFLAEERRRPLHATAARSNTPSRRILEKCGFRCVGFRMGEETDRFVAREIAEFVLE
jgi:RimJ/RimL family protein N-acetyltransferase